MKVMMIGLTSAGKTSYMGAMYRRFRGEGAGGFSIKAIEQSDDLALCRIGEDLVVNGKYPSGTDIRSLYRFNLYYQGEMVLDFDWTDYRGGLLVDFDSSVEEIEKWENELVSSDAVIVFLDSTNMTVAGDGGNYNGFTQMEALSDLIQKVATSHAQGAFPISFVLTKIDMLKHELGGVEWEHLQEIRASIARSKNIHGMLTGTIVGGSCINIEFPFLMSMVFGLLNNTAAVVKEYNEKLEEFNRRVSNVSVWDDIGSFLSGESSWRELAQKSLTECFQKKERFEKLKEPLELLVKVLDETSKNDDYLMSVF